MSDKFPTIRIINNLTYRDGWQPSGAWCSTRGWPWEVKSEPMPVPPRPLTEEDVRRIVREEIASAMQGKGSK